MTKASRFAGSSMMESRGKRKTTCSGNNSARGAYRVNRILPKWSRNAGRKRRRISTPAIPREAIAAANLRAVNTEIENRDRKNRKQRSKKRSGRTDRSFFLSYRISQVIGTGDAGRRSRGRCLKPDRTTGSVARKRWKRDRRCV